MYTCRVNSYQGFVTVPSVEHIGVVSCSSVNICVSGCGQSYTFVAFICTYAYVLSGKWISG
jgi:hypothetical protein